MTLSLFLSQSKSTNVFGERAGHEIWRVVGIYWSRKHFSGKYILPLSTRNFFSGREQKVASANSQSHGRLNYQFPLIMGTNELPGQGEGHMQTSILINRHTSAGRSRYKRNIWFIICKYLKSSADQQKYVSQKSTSSKFCPLTTNFDQFF